MHAHCPGSLAHVRSDKDRKRNLGLPVSIVSLLTRGITVRYGDFGPGLIGGIGKKTWFSEDLGSLFVAYFYRVNRVRCAVPYRFFFGNRLGNVL